MKLSLSRLALQGAARARQEFISLSNRYIEGDEERLPYPELSAKGRSLYKMSELLQKHQFGVVLAPCFEDPHLFLLRSEGHAIFTPSAADLSACIAAQTGQGVFEYWRGDPLRRDLVDLPGPVSFWIDPGKELERFRENVFGGYIGAVDQSVIARLGEIGLLHAREVTGGFWLTR